jgi:hypothetical protein
MSAVQDRLPHDFAALPALLAVLLVSALAFASPADARTHAHIYWTTNGGEYGGDIGRANLNGTGVNPDFVDFTSFPDSFGPPPHDIAVRGGYIYWASWGGYIGRIKIDGTHAQPKFINVDYFSPTYLAVNARHLYWTGLGFEEPNVIGRANLNGTGVKNIFFQSETNPFHLAIGGGHVYWTAFHSLLGESRRRHALGLDRPRQPRRQGRALAVRRL